ncbi:hypothetical protein ACJMK2_015255 [Sinanodonta woodiana]|uniref:Homeobox domain-containing protein n=1 Tax=Sinanodonta woodiana TaxID=1069815 RepID=A0ABD3V326_SINWO
MATSPFFTFGDSPSSETEKKLSASGRISLSDIVAATIGPLYPEEISSDADLLNYAGNSRYDADEPSSTSTGSAVILEKSCDPLLPESSRASFHSGIVNSYGSLRDDSSDTDLEQSSSVNGADDLVDILSPSKETGMIPLALKYAPSLDLSSNSIWESRHQASFNGLPYLLSDTALHHNPNPLFKDLQALLLEECTKNFLPTTLIDICTPDPTMDVHSHEPTNDWTFGHLNMPDLQRTNQMSIMCPCEFELNNTEPVNVFHDSDHSCSNKGSVTSPFDLDLHTKTSNVENGGNVLDGPTSIRNSKRYAPYMRRQRQMLSRHAVRMMEDWYAKNNEHPYPNSYIVDIIATTGGITNEQVKKWFANKRNRCRNTR